MAFDSSDAWAHPEMFQFDADFQPIAVAGCPPDAFSATGQLWGNPLYNWDSHRDENYKWWVSRIRTQLTNLDIVYGTLPPIRASLHLYEAFCMP